MLIQPQFLKLQADPGPLPLTCSPGPWHPWVQAVQYLGRRGLFTAQAWGLTRLQPCSPKIPRRVSWEGLRGQSQRPLSRVIYMVLEPAPGKYISQVMPGGSQRPLL